MLSDVIYQNSLSLLLASKQSPPQQVEKGIIRNQESFMSRNILRADHLQVSSTLISVLKSSNMIYIYLPLS